MRRAGAVLIAIVALIPILLILLTTPASRLDPWNSDARKGDETIVFGRVRTESHPDEGVYYYELSGSDARLYSRKDIADEGEYVILKVRKDEETVVIEAKYSISIVLLPMLLLLVFGSVLVIHGSRSEPPVRRSEIGEIRFCERCGFPLKHVAAYDRWYCYHCRAYEEPPAALPAEVIPAPAAHRARCPACGAVFVLAADHGEIVECPECGARGRL